jgi:hypothetical protein
MWGWMRRPCCWPCTREPRLLTPTDTDEQVIEELAVRNASAHEDIKPVSRSTDGLLQVLVVTVVGSGVYDEYM